MGGSFEDLRWDIPEHYTNENREAAKRQTTHSNDHIVRNTTKLPYHTHNNINLRCAAQSEETPNTAMAEHMDTETAAITLPDLDNQPSSL